MLIRNLLCIVFIVLFSHCSKNNVETKLLEGNWLSKKLSLNGNSNLLNTREVFLHIYDIEKNTGKFEEYIAYKTSNDTISSEKGSFELVEDGTLMIKQFGNTSIFVEQNIYNLTKSELRYTSTINEINYEFTFEKQ